MRAAGGSVRRHWIFECREARLYGPLTGSALLDSVGLPQELGGSDGDGLSDPPKPRVTAEWVTSGPGRQRGGHLSSPNGRLCLRMSDRRSSIPEGRPPGRGVASKDGAVWRTSSSWVLPPGVMNPEFSYYLTWRFYEGKHRCFWKGRMKDSWELPDFKSHKNGPSSIGLYEVFIFLYNSLIFGTIL